MHMDSQDNPRVTPVTVSSKVGDSIAYFIYFLGGEGAGDISRLLGEELRSKLNKVVPAGNGSAARMLMHFEIQ